MRESPAVTIQPNVAEAADDPQRERLYLAEELAQEEFSEPEYLRPEGLVGFAARALERAGWDWIYPTFVLDVTDESEWSGWHEGATGVIHLHPDLLDPWTVLHELAHWVDPRQGHGPRFCAHYVNLVRAALGGDAAEELLSSCEAEGVEVDREWLFTV